jgi:hypothetical protein
MNQFFFSDVAEGDPDYNYYDGDYETGSGDELIYQDEDEDSNDEESNDEESNDEESNDDGPEDGDEDETEEEEEGKSWLRMDVICLET